VEQLKMKGLKMKKSRSSDQKKMTWRNLRLKPGLALLFCMLCYHFLTVSIVNAQSGGLPGSQRQAGSMISVDFKALVSKADLDFKEQLGGPKAERGLPVGNGRMGTLLWTAPEQSKLHMQVNHTDVFAFRNSSASTRRDRPLTAADRGHTGA
jgi:hypothetical protein